MFEYIKISQQEINDLESSGHKKYMEFPVHHLVLVCEKALGQSSISKLYCH